MADRKAQDRLLALSEAGVSIWLDDLSRQRLDSGTLAHQVEHCHVSGVTTNPTIFAAAFADMAAYGAQLAQLAGQPLDQMIRTLMTTDVKAACRVLAPVFEQSGGYDGRVSIEVEPGLANDASATLAQARLLHDMVDEPNVLVKIPATLNGLGAIRQTIAAGISVNVTLIFSIKRYQAVLDAYMAGLEDALAAGLDISSIHSVASFFVSRVDTEVDQRLTRIGGEAADLMGKAGVANARAAFAEFERITKQPRFQALQRAGANMQRPLWASTGTKNPACPDTLYVDALIARPCVNTMPQATMDAFADHGSPQVDTITDQIDNAWQTLHDLEADGIDYDEVTATLEAEGIAKFTNSWDELVEAVRVAVN